MKYKIVIVYPVNESIDVQVLNARCEKKSASLLMPSSLSAWKNLELYGVHIFECDDLETFDLLEAQREKDEPARQIHLELESNKYIDTAPMQRKAEIRRIAEKLYQSESFNGLNAVVSAARFFVDNFDAEFERLEGEK